MRVELHPEARAEFRSAAVWYDEQRLGLGDEFVADVTGDVCQNRRGSTLLRALATRQGCGRTDPQGPRSTLSICHRLRGPFGPNPRARGDACFTDLERQVGPRRLQFGSAHRAFHGFGLLVFADRAMQASQEAVKPRVGRRSA